MAVNTERLDELIRAGDIVVGTRHMSSGGRSRVSDELFEQWRMSSLSFLEATYSRNNIYYQRFVERCNHATPNEAQAGLSILRAVKEDIEAAIELGTGGIGISDLPLHPRIAEVSLGLYADGHYDDAVLDASKALINLVKEKSRRDDIDGVGLMTEVFSKDNPILAFNELSSRSDKDEQQGMMHLFQGAVLAIRNPRGHEFPGDSPERAMEYISFISMLAKFVSESRRV